MARATPSRSDSSPPTPGGGPLGPRPPTDPSSSRWMLIALAVSFAIMWFWKTRTETETQPPVAYSVFYDWLSTGHVESVVMTGDVIDGTLKTEQTVEGKSVKTFRTYLPANDSALLPLLREKGVRILVKSQQQPFAVQVLLTLMPWALIIGFSWWMSRRARGMLGAGGPLGNIIGNRGRKFDKDTSVQVTFDDVEDGYAIPRFIPA